MTKTFHSIRIVHGFCLIAGVALLSACGSDSTTPTDTSGGGGGGGGITYITWVGNDNGAWVLDATNDSFRFRSDTRRMVFGSTTYTNTYVDGSANFSVSSSVVGGIYGVTSTTGGTVAAIVCLNGQVIDFYGWESSLSFTCSSGVIPAATSSTWDGLQRISPQTNDGASGLSGTLDAYRESNAILEKSGAGTSELR